MNAAPEQHHPRLSLCMIVRDGERSLRAAIESARPFVDDIVVVDTGSRDASRQIAASAGARLFDFPWCDDFSAARNHSIEQAAGDWVFWMDSDDTLPPESGAELRRLVQSQPERTAAFWARVEQESIGANGQPRVVEHGQIKLFPRHPEIRFCYRVHEQITPALKRSGIPLKPSRLCVRHSHADRSPEANARRIARNLRLLEMDLADRPDDPFVLFNLGNTYLFLPGGLPMALDYTRRSLLGLERGSSVRLNAYLFLAKTYAKGGDSEGEWQACRDAIVEFPDDAMLLLYLGVLYERRGELRQAAESYEKLLRSSKLRLSVFHFRDLRSRAVLRLGKVYLRLREHRRACRLWRLFLERHPEDQAVKAALARVEFPRASKSRSNSPPGAA